jgi:hypothetical protein
MMAGEISVFGYSIPLTVVLVFIALVVGLALAVIFWLTIVQSILQSVKRTRRQRVHDDLQQELLERTFAPEADWEAWTDGLSRIERDVVESLLDEYLRELDGRNLEQLRGLGDALGIPARSKRQLQQDDEFVRLTALTWLTLLGDSQQIAEFDPRTPRERALVARIRYESDTTANSVALLSILLDGPKSQYTIFGQDTLYRIATSDPEALLQRAANEYQTWSRPLLIQVLSVCQHLGTSVTTEDLSWLTATLEDDDEMVRAATARALGAFGWRGDIRDGRLLDRLTRDESPHVRSAVYEMLARWGDEQAVRRLTVALRTEANPRARLAGMNALVTHQNKLEADIEELDEIWAWSQTHAAYDSAARKRQEWVGG